MEAPVPNMDAGETNVTVKRIHTLCVQARRAYHTDLLEVEKRALFAFLKEGKRAADAYNKGRDDRTRGVDALNGLNIKDSKYDTDIATQKIDTARFQTLTDSRKARLEVAQANAERFHHSARAAALQQRQITVENVKLEFEVKSSKNEWSGLLSQATELSQRFNALFVSSPKLQNRHRETEVIDALRKKCDDLDEEKTQLTEREEYYVRQVAKGKERSFRKYVRCVAKFILKEKMNLAKCFEQEEEKQRLLQKQAQKRAAGQIDPMDASFADFDDSIVMSAPSSQTVSQAEKAGSQMEQAKAARPALAVLGDQINATKKDGPFAVPATVYKQAAPKPATVVIDTDDSAHSLASDARSCSSSSLSSSDLCVSNLSNAKLRATIEAAAPRPLPSPQKRVQPVVATPVVAELTRAVSPSPVMETPAKEPLQEEVADEIDEDMDNDADQAAAVEEETMDVGIGGGSEPEVNQNNNSFQFRMSPTGDNGLANFFDSSQIQDNNMDTDAVLNISVNSNDPGGDFLALMQGHSDKDKGGGSPDEFSFGGMFGGSDNGNDAGGSNEFAFDFNGGGSSPGDQNASFSFNFGGGDNTSNNDGGDNGGFFFPF